jgi:hypothetical protein
VDNEEEGSGDDDRTWSETSGLEEGSYPTGFSMSSPEFDTHLPSSLSPPTTSQYLSVPRVASAPAYLDTYSQSVSVAPTPYSYATYGASDPTYYTPGFPTEPYSQAFPGSRAFQTPDMPSLSRANMSTPVMQAVVPNDDMLNPLSLNYAMLTGMSLPTSSAELGDGSKSQTHRPTHFTPRNRTRGARCSITLDNDYMPPSTGLNFNESWTGDVFGQGLLYDC